MTEKLGCLFGLVERGSSASEAVRGLVAVPPEDEVWLHSACPHQLAATQGHAPMFADLGYDIEAKGLQRLAMFKAGV